jgi:hypothetical protein
VAVSSGRDSGLGLEVGAAGVEVLDAVGGTVLLGVGGGVTLGTTVEVGKGVFVGKGGGVLLGAGVWLGATVAVGTGGTGVAVLAGSALGVAVGGGGGVVAVGAAGAEGAGIGVLLAGRMPPGVLVGRTGVEVGFSATGVLVITLCVGVDTCDRAVPAGAGVFGRAVALPVIVVGLAPVLPVSGSEV